MAKKKAPADPHPPSDVKKRIDDHAAAFLAHLRPMPLYSEEEAEQAYNRLLAELEKIAAGTGLENYAVEGVANLAMNDIRGILSGRLKPKKMSKFQILELLEKEPELCRNKKELARRTGVRREQFSKGKFWREYLNNLKNVR